MRPEVPSCRHFGQCGGCSQLDVPIEEQVRAKADRLQQALQPVVGNVQVESALPPALPLHYRTKLLYPVRAGSDGRPELGIYARGTHDLVRIEECRTQDKSLTALGIAAERILRNLRLQPWNEQRGTGFVRAFHARLAPGTGELLLGVVTRPGLFPAGAELAEELFEAASSLPRSHGKRVVPTGVVRSISDRDGNYLFGDRNVPLKGRDYHEDRVDGLVFRLRFGSFYQVHRAASAVLYRPALALAGNVPGQRVVDGYGGVGTFGLRCARNGARQVEVIEDNSVACGDAKHNAAANGLDQVSVIQAPFAQAEFAPGADLLIVDPPRSGLGPSGIKRVLAADPGRLLCVHCSADSLVRDLTALTAAGFVTEAVRLCDMFPHTDHVEVVSLLRRPQSPPA